jgi:hypothetical protein
MMKYECVYEGWQSFLLKGSKPAMNLNVYGLNVIIL